MFNNKGLQNAAKNKKDEFYTQFSDIEKEVRHYIKHFRNKIVFLNCDNHLKSNFFKFFFTHFDKLGLKKLVSLCLSEPAYAVQVTDGKKSLLQLGGNGDFRSLESIHFLKEADIVVTNPPFSLFREYIDQLINYEKKFLILGNLNAVTYKNFSPLLIENKVWIGPSIHSGDRKFTVPDDYPLDAATCGIDESGKKYIKVKGVRWFTNLDFEQRHKPLVLTKRYDLQDCPSYDNYNAIEVGKISNIPSDYFGVMGVPVTFFDKYCPEQFEILGTDSDVKAGKLAWLVNTSWTGKLDRAYLKGKRCYARLLIRHKQN